MTRSPWPIYAGLLAAGLAIPAGARADLPPVPQGVEVQARGPVHEAFASPTAEPVETKAVPKRPPAALDEMPPEQKPDGEVIWISGYWAWDDDRSDFLWVSGTWRSPPPGKQWVSGYWREEGSDWQWVPGFWSAKAAAAAQPEQPQEVTYLPSPPATPQTTDPGKPPADDTFFVPGSWVWNGNAYAWRAGYWARVQPGYVWVPDHFRWTPAGYVYVAGYWDLALRKRGILYAPVVIRPEVVTVGFVYTPTYAVRDTVIVDSMFVRPAACHYYFGDYYGPRYTALGYESTIVYSQRRYDSIIVYERYERRRDPTWVSVQINTYNDRYSGRAAPPPRTVSVVQNNVVNNTTIINNNVTVAPVTQVAMTKNVTMVNVDNSTRVQAKAQAASVAQVGAQRAQAEVKAPAGAPRQARVASLSVPKAEAVKPGMAAPKAAPAAARVAPAKPAANTAAPRAAVPPPKAAPQAPTRPAPPARPAVAPPRPGQPAQAKPAQPAAKTPRPAQAAPPRPQPPQPTRRPPPRDEKRKEKDR